MSGALICAATNQGMLLDCLALETRGACIPGPHGALTIREIVLGRIPPPGYCTFNRLKHITSLSMKEVYLFILEFQPEGQASGVAHI